MASKVEVRDIDHGWRDIKREVKKFRNGSTKVGLFSSGSGGPSSSLAARGAVNEYGATIKVTEKMRWWWLFNFGKKLKKSFIKIPKRPFMRMSFDKNKKEIRKFIKREYYKVLLGRSTAKKSLGRIGEWFAGEIKETIKNGNFKANSNFTKKQKGSSKPLIDTGQMRNSITHKESF